MSEETALPSNRMDNVSPRKVSAETSASNNVGENENGDDTPSVGPAMSENLNLSLNCIKPLKTGISSTSSTSTFDDQLSLNEPSLSSNLLQLDPAPGMNNEQATVESELTELLQKVEDLEIGKHDGCLQAIAPKIPYANSHVSSNCEQHFKVPFFRTLLSPKPFKNQSFQNPAFLMPMGPGYRPPHPNIPNQSCTRGPADGSMVTPARPVPKPCHDHVRYQTRLFCKTHRKIVCCICALKTFQGPHSACIILPNRSILPDSKIRLEATRTVDSLAEQLLMKLSAQGASNVLVQSPQQHLSFNTSLQSSCPFRMSPALTDFITDMNFLIVSINTCYTKDLETLMSRITNCATRFDRLPDFLEKCPPYLPNCSLHGQGITHAYKRGTNAFFVSVRDHKGEPCTISAAELVVNAQKLGEDQDVHVEPYYMPGVYKVTYFYRLFGMCTISVRINGQLVPGSPFNVCVEPDQPFSEGAGLVCTIGDVLNFNKPWGTCVDNQGNYIVADRCNNCVKVFSSEWKFKRYFPFEGTPHSLKKPAGVAIDRDGHLVITDKDNHRVQVFTVSGEPLRRTNPSETSLSFPWGLAVNSQNQYIVTHSKCMVKILSSDFETLHEISMGSSTCVLNPRGVTIGYMDEILITEFEGGDVYALDVNTYKFRTMRRNQPRTENQAPYVRRYQGIAVDRDGYVLVCDSKNRCVEIYNYAGDYIVKWTMPGKPVFIVPLNTRPKSYVITLEEGESNLVVFSLGVTGNCSVDL